MKNAHFQWAARTTIALAVIMAIGCGDSSGKDGKRAHIKRSLQTKLLNQNAKNGQNGNVNYTSKNGGGSMSPTAASNVDEAFSAVAAAGSPLNGVEALEDGAYTLKGVTTQYKLMDTATGEEIDTMSTSTLNGDQLQQTNSLNNNVKLSTKDAGRLLIAPYKFNKQGSAIAAQQNLVVSSTVGTDTRITDTVNGANGVNALSLLDSTKGDTTALSKNQGDFGYQTVDKNVPVFIRVSHVSDTEVRFVIEFTEAGASASGQQTNQQKSITRIMVLSYGFAKAQSLEDAAKTAAQTQLDNNGAIVGKTTATASASDDKTDTANAADDAAAAADLGLPPAAGDDRLPSP